MRALADELHRRAVVGAISHACWLVLLGIVALYLIAGAVVGLAALTRRRRP